jgi:peptidoglycan/xylan/chitin deacetylase (PgdA/CDA1 family)
VLTFDDGPNPEHTPRLLDELQRHGVTATFFVVGGRAAKHPEIVRRIVAEGHELGHHSYLHSEPAQTSAATLMAEVRQSRELLEDITGQICDLFRPPKGQLTLAKLCLLWQARQTIVVWNIAPRDYLMTSTEEIEIWARNYYPAAGDLVLLHDNRPMGVKAVPHLAARAAERGLVFQHVSDWVPQRAVTPRAHATIEG